jgi:ABC-type Na+ efflux pump permease subunit
MNEFDNLREDATSNLYEEAQFQSASGTESALGTPSSRRILGMTAFQRFVIAFMLFLAVCIVGAMALLVTSKIGF